MTIQNPKGVGRAIVRVKSVQLPGKVEVRTETKEVIKEVPVEVIKEVIKEVPVSNLTAEQRAHEAEKKLAEAMETIAKIQSSDEPPEDIADIYEAYGMDPEALFKLHTDLTSRIAGNLPISDHERSLQSRLTPHVPWIKKRAKSIEVV